MGYSRTFGSNYPSTLIPLGTHKDVDNTIVNLVNQYNAYVQAGNMTTAMNYYAQNRSKLEPYMINTSYINRLEEEIYNTGLYALSNSSSITSNTEPTVEQAVDSYWLQDY